MAKLVLGIGASHAPQLGIPAEKWQLLREKDENDGRMNFAQMAKKPRPGMEKELTPEKWQKRYSDCMKALAGLRETLEKVAPDVVVIVGDDQHEHLLDDNMPVFCIYRGASVPAVERKDRMKVAWKAAEIEGRNIRLKSFTCAPNLAEHLIQHLSSEGFDVACSNQLRPEIGLGHAFTAMYSQLMPDGRFPIVPFMVNTFYPPNQPHPRRCYSLGESLRKAIEAWDGNKRVAILASGGLSHVIIDEEIDQVTIDGVLNKDKEKLCSLPVEKLLYGTSEIRNWVVLAGAVEDFDVKLLDYVPCYRSMAGTGCAMAFAQWT
jgi:3-O-methylgallate 3,4-dioxygenase